MKKTLIASVLCAAFATPAFAQSAAPAAEASPHTLTGNVGLFSSYRFRGIDQTFGKPAVQGGVDYSHSSGFYVGNWNSNVSEGAGYPGGNLEMDLYGGYKTSFGDVGIDVGAIYYYYPGSEAAGFGGNKGAVNNKEVYVGASWQFLSLKYYHAVDDYFSAANTKGTNYLDLAGTYDLGDGWGVNAHVGRLNMKNSTDGDYTDWKVGVTKDINGWIVGASWVDTNAKKSFYTLANNVNNDGSASADAKFKNLGRGIAVVSVSRSF